MDLVDPLRRVQHVESCALAADRGVTALGATVMDREHRHALQRDGEIQQAVGELVTCSPALPKSPSSPAMAIAAAPAGPAPGMIAVIPIVIGIGAVVPASLDEYPRVVPCGRGIIIISAI